MLGKNGSKLKILYLIEIFRLYTDDNHVLSASDICDLLEEKYNLSAERKSIYSDIETLQNYGMDIIFARSPKKGYFLANREFELPEIRLLIDAVQSAGFITPKKSSQLINKIKLNVSNYQADTILNQVYIDNRVKCNNEEIYYNIDLLNEAIENKKQVRLVYIRNKINEDLKPVKEEKLLKVNPYALIWSDDHYYLVGNNPKYDNLMHLRIDRMKKVEVLEDKVRPFSEVSEFEEKFDVALYASRMFNMFSGKAEKISLICDNDIYEEILDRFGKNCVIKVNDDNTFTVNTTATLGSGLVSWIMQFGSNMKVEYPQELKDYIVEKAKEISNLYR